MKDALRIGAITLVVFAAGLATGIWTQRLRPVPAPPLPPLGEMGAFRDKHRPHDEPMRFPLSREKAAELEAATARLRPQIKAFEEKLAGIEKDFHAKFEAILTPEQKKIFSAKPPPPLDPPPSESRFPDRMMGSLGGLAFFTIITPAQEHFGKELGLSPEQQAKLKELLIARRQAFLDFVDTTPPPSLELGRMMRPPPHEK